MPGSGVGEVLLNKVAEVSVPLDENNVPRAPDPKVPTATADLASLASHSARRCCRNRAFTEGRGAT